MKEVLLEFENLLVEQNAPILKYFNRGMAKNETVNHLKKINLEPNEELLQLYEWKNGIQFRNLPTGKINLGVNGCFLPIESSIMNYRSDVENKLYKNFYFPVFSNDCYLINLKESTKKYGRIYIYSPSLLINKPEVCFDDLTTMFTVFLEGFKQQALFYDSEGFLECDYSVFGMIANNLNFSTKYWK